MYTAVFKTGCVTFATIIAVAIYPKKDIVSTIAFSVSFFKNVFIFFIVPLSAAFYLPPFLMIWFKVLGVSPINGMSAPTL